MTWRDKLQPGSFRKVPFRCISSGGLIGRRWLIHEYPNRDLPSAEDMGRKARKVTVEIYVFGANYMAERDALIKALDAAGPGTFVDPYLGSMQAAATEVRGPRHSTREGGMARFTVTFAEAGENTFPTATSNGPLKVAATAEIAKATIIEDFEESFTTKGFAAWVDDAAQELISSISTRIADLAGSVPGVPQAITDYDVSLSGLVNNVSSLIGTPYQLATEITRLIDGFSALPQRASDSFSLQRNLWSFGDDSSSVATTTPSRKQQASNQTALINLVQQSAVVASAQTATTLTYDSAEQVIVARDAITEQLQEVEATADDDTWRALVDLRGQVIEDLTTRAAQLPSVTSYVPLITMPSLVLAHQIYGDANRETEIVTRNQITHPGFVSGGDELEILSDV